MQNRRQFATRIALAGITGHLVRAEEPWSASEIMQPADLAARINANTAPPVLCVAFPTLYRQRHIKGAVFAGPGNKPEGINTLKTTVSSFAKDAEVVIYCGCCPMDVCPNIRPSYETLKGMGFTKIRVLSIPRNMHNDWVTKGYPSEPPQAPRDAGV